MTPLSRGLVEMLAVVVAFVALGLLGQGGATARLEAAAHPEAAVYPGRMAEEPTNQDGTLWLVDGYNVLCAGLLGGRERSRWWAAERRGELLEVLARFDEPDAEIWVVFDGEQTPDPPGGEADRIRTIFAPSADAWLVEEVKRRAGDRPVAVVTADRKVAGRARHRGARVVAPRELIGRCMG
jgi:predicted RNA-binding protein with PIN domain